MESVELGEAFVSMVTELIEFALQALKAAAALLVQVLGGCSSIIIISLQVATYYDRGLRSYQLTGIIYINCQCCYSKIIPLTGAQTMARPRVYSHHIRCPLLRLQPDARVRHLQRPPH